MSGSSRAAIYARYSSDLQRATSLPDQIRLDREFATRAGYSVADAHVCTDAEISGTTAERPGYRRLLGLAKDHEIDAIICEAPDRLWRDAGEMHQALKRLKYWGVRVLSVATSPGIDLTDRVGKILSSIIGLKDELFVEDLKDRVRRGMIGQVHRRFSVGGRAFGYRSEPVQEETGKVIGHRRVIDPGEAETVRYIFRLYCDGLTPRAICHRLNAERVQPPRGLRGRKTGSWAPATIAGSTARALGILNNPLYTGKIAWNRSYKVRDPETGKRHMRPRPRAEWVWADEPSLRIVSDDLWERVQARRQQRAWVPGAREGARPKYLLSGLLVCGECGARYVIQTHRAGSDGHYGCAAHADRGPTVCANGRLVRREVAEQKIVDYVFSDLFTPARLDYLTRAVNSALERTLRQAPDTAAQRLDALRTARRELENIANAIRAGIITPTTKTMIEDAERRVAALEQAARDVRRHSAPVVSVKSVVTGYLTNLREMLGTNVDEARRLLARALDKIVLQRDGHRLVAEITGNFAGILPMGEAVFGSDGAGRGI
ncbi:MAG TPA: recombinase family protein [bacterium]|nr:recombinase family protein [bacterium]